MSRPRVLITHRPFPQTVELLATRCEVDVNQTPGHTADSRTRGRSASTTFSSCDAVVVSAPLTPHTAGTVGADRLARLPAHAVLANVGRASVIDEDAVAAALDRGSLGAYAADVFEPPRGL